MNHSMLNLMFQQFITERERYLQLRSQRDQVSIERAKVCERLKLFQQLLTLEGKQVELP